MCVLSKLLNTQIWQELDGAARMMNAGKLDRRAFLPLCLLHPFLLFICFFIWLCVSRLWWHAGSLIVEHRLQSTQAQQPQHVGSWFPDQGLNPRPLPSKVDFFTLWTTRKAPPFSYPSGQNSASSTHDILPSTLNDKKREEWFFHF